MSTASLNQGVGPVGSLRRGAKALLLWLGVTLAWTGGLQAQTVPIRDLTRAANEVPVRLLGYGLVVGLDGSGDQTSQTPYTVQSLENMLKQFGITLFGLGDVRQGILHIVGPEQGITQPGLVIAGADSHTSTHGALGAFAFGQISRRPG